MLGADVYHLDYEQKDYNELLDLAKGKLIALSEVGELPNSLVLDAQPKWCYFLVWSDFITGAHNTKQQVQEVYNREQTLTRDEVQLPK
jgi:mannan endo-1,4-beta-mannosidase